MIPHELLWKAWPLGYVPIRGVATVDGYVCVAAAGLLRRFRREEDGAWVEGTTLDQNDAGFLLPNVDPSDTATWACLLRDLAEAADGTGYIAGGTLAYLGALWRRRSDPGVAWWWELIVHTSESGVVFTQTHPFTLDTEDPAIALVLARIELREREVSP